MDWFDALPREILGHWPTPLEHLPRLSAELGGPRIWAKRDDCAGLATGGNKTRKLEYLIADALTQNADTVVTYGAVQSNHARQTAAACAKVGLDCHLVLTRRVDWPHPEYETGGNVLVDELCGATLHVFDLDAVEEGNAELMQELDASGRRTYRIPPGGSSAVGALGYVRCARELSDQATAQGIQLNKVVHASASAGTQAGLVFGFMALDLDTEVLGINVFHPEPQHLQERVRRLVDELTAAHPNAVPAGTTPEISVNHAYFGGAYGQPTEATLAAIRMAASLEGLLFDPVYSGKALAALIDQVNLGNFDDQDDVVIVHTGGAMSLSVYSNAFTSRRTSLR